MTMVSSSVSTAAAAVRKSKTAGGAPTLSYGARVWARIKRRPLLGVTLVISVCVLIACLVKLYTDRNNGGGGDDTTVDDGATTSNTAVGETGGGSSGSGINWTYATVGSLASFFTFFFLGVMVGNGEFYKMFFKHDPAKDLADDDTSSGSSFSSWGYASSSSSISRSEPEPAREGFMRRFLNAFKWGGGRKPEEHKDARLNEEVRI